MRLLIVESPNKIKKIRSFLPQDFRVSASVGHVRDLPVGKDGSMGVDFGDHIEPHYVETKPDVIAKLRAEAKQADSIWLATDPDREGEAIAWHIAECLGSGRDFKRVAFQSITKKAVTKALEQPGSIDMNMVNAQQARRVLDRVVGWMVSPVLRRNCGKEAKSAGRVQSVALRIVAEREQEIQAFVKADYFVLEADFRGDPKGFTAKLVQLAGQDLGHRLATAADAEALRAALEPGPWAITDVQQKTLNKQPPPPFTTSTAQQAASVHLKLGPKESMAALQRLFEAGHITYHRTDSVALDPEAIAEARAIIERKHGADFLPDQPRVFATRNENAQEAHEAIRPTHPEHGTDIVPGPDGKLYRLIWERFIACQMAAAIDETTTYTILSGGDPTAVFQAKGIVVRFDGWRALTNDDATAEEQEEREPPLPAQQPGDVLDLDQLRSEQRSTKPPPRYTQASLIKKLEREGVGRPSTYASIMGTILNRGYVAEKRRKLHATDLGIQVSNWLCQRFNGDFIEIGYTRDMESALDDICRGSKDWEAVVNEAASGILQRSQAAGLAYNPLKGETRFQSEIVEGKACPLCGAPMRSRSGKFGIFYGCSTYPACKGTLPGPDDGQRRPTAGPSGSAAPPPPQPAGGQTTRGPSAKPEITCPKCGGAMYLVMDGGTPFYSCNDYPRCPGTRDA